MSCFTCYGRQYRLCTSRSFQRGFASLDSSTLAGGSLGGRGCGASGPELLPPRHSVGCSCRVKGLCPRPVGCRPHQHPLTRHPLDGTATDVVWPEEASRAGPEAQPKAQRREGVRIPGEAFTLDASGSHAACRPGEGTTRSRWACSRGQSGKNGRGMQPRGGHA